MAKGDGSITQRGRGSWRVRISAGFEPTTGKRRYVTATVRGTKADARRERDRLRAEVEGGLKVDARNVTLSEFIPIWADAKRTSGKIMEETLKGYLSVLKHAEELLGGVPLRKIDAPMVEAVCADVRAKGLSGTTSHNVHMLLKSVFNKACDYGYATRNPCNKVDSPKANEPDRRSLTPQEASRLLDRLDESEEKAYRELADKERRMLDRGKAFGRSYVKGVSSVSQTMAVRIGLATGARLSEVLALQWRCVDLESGQVSICRALKKDGALKEPKTAAGTRTASVDRKTVGHLARWKARQAAELAKFGIRQTPETPVCCSTTGGFINISNFERWWRSFRDGNGFEGLRFHELRHTQATLLLGSGVDVKTVQARLGHADASITLNWYAHAMPGNDRQAADLLAAIMEHPEKAARTA